MNTIKKTVFKVFDKITQHQSGVDSLVRCLGPIFGKRFLTSGGIENTRAPYSDLPQSNDLNQTNSRSDIVLLTGRFRSGSTLLWNVFRQLDGTTSFYEPFNERRWFDPQTRGANVDGTHRQVNSYWEEYEDAEDLAEFYHEDWIRRGLYMDEGSWDGQMKRYLERMIEHSSGRPVLQFNRIDFRLPWFRHYFPNAKIIHIYRHPREQWCSTLQDISLFGPEDGTIEDFSSADKFYLRTWVNDLKPHFPFLAETSVHPYRHYYWIWKLSYLFGQQYAHHSLCFENLVAQPNQELKAVFDLLNIEIQDWTKIESIFEKPVTGRWQQYASNEWFRAHESECETVLDAFLGRSDATLKS
ncbi:sulfotransferase [Thalassoglobus polymorphus]|uniref:Sulfotransferase domain protein n=1 Tax=Thalassoglobus polymorphus TaxID=2527994 RepID=A0A517QSN3_9PLAN|nr:sulfotransferase [Thalassoglobus polymorphus]QDT34644.1 hypothetical protein Mal48_39120 [Thalassoglobus polymorphus]